MRLTALLFAIFLLVTSVAQAQYDQSAKKLLDRTRKTYENMKGFETDFAYTMKNPTANVEETLEGHVQVMGDMFILETGSQTIYNNGKRIWTFLQDINEVTITDFSEDNTEVSPSALLKKYQKGFKYIMAESQDGLSVVDLTPENKDETYFRIRIFIDSKTATIKKWVMSEKDGTKHNYSLKNFAERKEFTKTMFAFPTGKYPDAEVIDLTEG
ncbi:MAG: outer membrane lipoprotein carrier protein LolA [Bacteroidota bacterium]